MARRNSNSRPSSRAGRDDLGARTEREVLGGLMVFPRLLAEAVSAGVTADSFTASEHRAVFEAMARCDPADLASGAFSAVTAQLDPASVGVDRVAEMMDFAHNLAPEDIVADWRRLLEPRRRAAARPATSRAPESGGDGADEAVVTRLSTVKTRPVEWLWPSRIPLGMLTVLDGDPGLGKSTVTLDLAARLSCGRAMPDGSPGPQAASVVILSAEDDLARVIRPRLEVAGADLVRIVTVAIRGHHGEKREPTICPEDLAAVEQAVRDEGALLVIVDPLMAYLPSDVNAHRDQDVRRALAALRALAERTGAAVVVIRHLNKSGGGLPIYRGGGSIGIIGAARSGLMLAADPDDAEGRVLAMTKSNLVAAPPALRLRLVVDPGADFPRVSWEGDCGHTASTLLSIPGGAEERSNLEDAMAFLRELLKGGREVLATDGEEEARARGIRPRTLERGRSRLSVRAYRPVNPGPWYWRLPSAPGRSGGVPPVDLASPLPHADFEQSVILREPDGVLGGVLGVQTAKPSPDGGLLGDLLRDDTTPCRETIRGGGPLADRQAAIGESILREGSVPAAGIAATHGWDPAPGAEWPEGAVDDSAGRPAEPRADRTGQMPQADFFGGLGPDGADHA